MNLRQQAEANVVAARGSWDVPGFEACVDAEVERLKQALAPWVYRGFYLDRPDIAALGDSDLIEVRVGECRAAAREIERLKTLIRNREQAPCVAGD